MCLAKVNHAWQGLPGTLYKTLKNDTVEVWSKPLPANKVAVMVVNTGDTDASFSLSIADDVPGKPDGSTARDVWGHKDLSIEGGHIPLSLPSHDSSFLVL